MYEDQTQNYNPKIHEEQTTDPYPCHVVL